MTSEVCVAQVVNCDRVRLQLASVQAPKDEVVLCVPGARNSFEF